MINCFCWIVIVVRPGNSKLRRGGYWCQWFVQEVVEYGGVAQLVTSLGAARSFGSSCLAGLLTQTQ